MFSFLKQIFTWWHKSTLGTFIYTLFSGKFVGEDNFGNKYYSNSSGKRWVVYKNEIESTKIPPEWPSWIHFTKLNIPKENIKKFHWQKEISLEKVVFFFRGNFPTFVKGFVRKTWGTPHANS